MKSFLIGAAAVLLALGWAGAAQARNPHCSGGIVYWKQWYEDKAKGNLEDYKRELSRAIQQLEMCTVEDPKDYEAIGYLAWCYAEADSACAAGRAFAVAIDGLNAKGDKKGADRVVTNRDSYWANAFNEGIKMITEAQSAYPEFCKKPETPADETLKAEAAKKYDVAVASLTTASCIKPGEARTLRNLGTIFALRCEFARAEAILRDAMKVAPADSDLAKALRDVRTNIATHLIGERKYDEAIVFFSDLVKSDPNDPNLRLGLADAYFKRAQSREGDARKQDFKAAGDAYSKGAELKPDDPDLPFNAALAYQSAGEYELSEAEWRATLKRHPDDPQALSALGQVLAELKKFDEGIKVLHQAVIAEPKDKNLHRQLGAVYTKAGNNDKATEELMVYLALQNGQPAANAKEEAQKSAASPRERGVSGATVSTTAAKTLASEGAPEDIYLWTADNEKYQSWFYWSKRMAYHFKGGTLVQKSNWSAPDLKGGATGSSK